MEKTIKTDICIIGAGAAGLSVAVFAAQTGFSVTLIERHKMGGDCLNYGCVPSKALLAASHIAKIITSSRQFGIESQPPIVNYQKICQHIQDVQNKIAPNDSEKRMESLGINVIRGQAYFINSQRLQVDNKQIKAKYIVIATGSSASIPNIAGIWQTPYLTNETIFNLTSQPKHLIVIGGGPIGAEIAEAQAMLGTKVTQLVIGNLLSNDNQTMVDVIRQAFHHHQVNLQEQIDRINHISNTKQGIQVSYQRQGNTQNIIGSHLLLATGRKANMNDLELDVAGIQHNNRHIIVNKRLQTNVKRIYAIGDVIGSYQFTHIANYHASVIIRNMLFKWPTKVNYRAIPWVTYTYPELAHVGERSIHNIRDDDPHYHKLHFNFSDNDRAQTQRQTDGKISVLTHKNGQILACDIVHRHAGELLLPWILAINEKCSIRSLANLMVPYPTLSEISKHIASTYYTPLLFSKKMKCFLHVINYFL